MDSFNSIHESARRIEAFLFASSEEVDELVLQDLIVDDVYFIDVMNYLEDFYKNSYIKIINTNGMYKFGVDLAFIQNINTSEVNKNRKIDGVSLQTLSVIAFHQPITFNEINDILPNPITRKVLERLLSLDLVAPNTRKNGTGRAITYVTTQEFLDGFGLSDISELMDPEEVLDMFKEVNSPKPLELNRE